MTTRRELFLGAVFVLSAVLTAAQPKKSAPLEVTYYYMPG
jgi:hypothetical protein